MIAKFLGYLRDIWLSVVDHFMILVYAHIAPDWHFILKFLLICIFFLGSAFLAATIAEMRRHKMKFHFLLGLVIPYIYPVVQLWRLKVAEEALEEDTDPLSGLSDSVTARFKEIHQDQEEKKKERMNRFKPEAEKDEPEAAGTEIEPESSPEPEVPAEPEATAEPEAAPEPAAAEASVYTQRYFQGLAVDSSGARVGPFRLLTLKKMEFKVIRINNIQKDMASFEVDVKGKTKNIRLRYDNIETFEKI